MPAMRPAVFEQEIPSINRSITRFVIGITFQFVPKLPLKPNEFIVIHKKANYSCVWCKGYFVNPNVKTRRL